MGRRLGKIKGATLSVMLASAIESVASVDRRVGEEKAKVKIILISL